jgi:hypothetical protein
MKPRDRPKSHIAAAAALGAITHARWQSRELLSRRSMAVAADLLRGHAAELTFSPIGRDQLLSLALVAAADDVEHDRQPRADRAAILPEPGPSEADRSKVRQQVFQSGALPTAEASRVLDDVERRLRPECAHDRALSARLIEDAALHELLWDDPRLSCDQHTRRAMFGSIPLLHKRAEVLGRR